MKPKQLNEEHAELVVQHITYAKKLAAQFYEKKSNLGFDRDDFEGAAFLGLCDAARRYDPGRGMLFKTFVYFRIRGAMMDLLRQGGGIQRRQFRQLVQNRNQQTAPAASCTDAKQTVSGEDYLPYAFARTVSELANLLEILDNVNLRLHVSCDGAVELTYASDTNPEEIAVVRNSRKYLSRMISQLPDRQRQIVELRYYQGATFDEISDLFNGLSKSWISRLHATAIESLRSMVSEEQRKCDERIASRAM